MIPLEYFVIFISINYVQVNIDMCWALSKILFFSFYFYCSMSEVLSPPVKEGEETQNIKQFYQDNCKQGASTPTNPCFFLFLLLLSVLLIGRVLHSLILKFWFFFPITSGRVRYSFL